MHVHGPAPRRYPFSGAIWIVSKWPCLLRDLLAIRGSTGETLSAKRVPVGEVRNDEVRNGGSRQRLQLLASYRPHHSHLFMTFRKH